MVPARCELTALPTASNLIGAVTDREGKPLAGVQVTLKGPVERSLTSGPSGEVSAEGLPPGDYVAQVNVQEYLFKSEHVSVVPGGNASVRLSLTPRPRVSQALLTTKEVRIGMPVQFNPGSAQLDTHSTPLLTEVVDVLARNPSVRVEVQGHTDNSGDPAQNKQLSQQRAESVLRHLVEAGIDASRLEAKGYGDEQPLVPNLTPENRARNRRVQFMLIKP
jgi:outer membrane protein OmpA-like peptidoglycan-associated protein